VIRASAEGQEGFSPQISVYKGKCDSLQCLTFNSGFGKVSFQTIENETYYLAAHGCCGFDSAGDYNLTITSLETGNLCMDAIDIGTNPLSLKM